MINKLPAIRVNNYSELSEALKKFFVEYIINESLIFETKFNNGTLSENNIISLANEDNICDFIKNYNLFLSDCNFKTKNFFRKIKSGQLFKINFPAIVSYGGIFEEKEIYSVRDFKISSNYASFYYSDNGFYPLSWAVNKFKKNVYVYLEIKENCFMPIKKTKEEVIEFIKKKNLYFPQNLNNLIFSKSNRFIFARGADDNEIIGFSNTAKNKKISEIKMFR